MNALILAAGDVMGHLENSWDLHFGPWHLDLNALINEPIQSATGFNPMISKHVVMMLVAAAAVAALCIMSARRAVKDKGRGLVANMVEAIALFVRDEVARPGLGEHHYRRWYSYVATVFFFVLGCNLVGLLPPPFGATPTGNINITAGLAMLTLLMMIVGGMMEHGAFKFWGSIVPHGVPLWLWPGVWAIEAFGLITKPFALMIRLFANMTAGHVILAVLTGFLYFGNVGIGAFLGKMVAIGIPTVGFYLFILTFEIAIAFIQAFIFAYLSSIFIGLMVSHEH